MLIKSVELVIGALGDLEWHAVHLVVGLTHPFNVECAVLLQGLLKLFLQAEGYAEPDGLGVVGCELSVRAIGSNSLHFDLLASENVHKLVDEEAEHVAEHHDGHDGAAWVVKLGLSFDIELIWFTVHVNVLQRDGTLSLLRLVLLGQSFDRLRLFGS